MSSPEGTTRPRHRGLSLRVLYIAIGGVGLIAAVGTLLYPEVEFIQEFGPNIATESAAIVVTLAVVRRILDRQERNRRLRASVGALRKAARALRTMAESWSEMVKAALPRIPAERPTAYEELLASHYTEALALLDPRRSRARGESVEEAASRSELLGGRGVEMLVNQVSDARAALAGLSQAYAVVLDGDYVEALEALVDDRFTTLLTVLVAEEANPALWRRRLNLARGPREACFRALLLAIRIHNRLAEEAATQRSEHLVPRADVLDIALSLEDDLIVTPVLRQGFWSEPPLPGSMRAPESGTRTPRRRDL